MGDSREERLFRDISVKLLFKPFLKTGLSANAITVLNFLLIECVALVLFYFKNDLLGLLFCILGAMIDYIDGSVARARGGNTKAGQYLDTSLDYIFLMLLIGIISYAHNILILGYIAIVSMTFGNWVQYNGNENIKFPFYLTISFILGTSLLIGYVEYGITLIMFLQAIRTALIYWRSIWKIL